MKCIECKWYAGQTNDTYGVCKRYPQTANKSQNDWCGEYFDKQIAIEVTPEMINKFRIQFSEPTVFEAPKRGRKPKQ
jgi:rhamnogalacturonyl hydrolase YesR